MPAASQLSTTTKGVKIHAASRSGSMKASATFSECCAAYVLGVVSAKMRMTTVIMMVDIQMPLSPQVVTASAVISVAAAVLTSVFPKSTTERIRSGFSTMRATRRAPRTLVVTRCSSRTF